MFGVIPKALWSRVIESDEKNRIPLALNCLLIQAGEKNILVDTGAGTKENAKFRDIYRADPVGMLLPQLEHLGVKDVDIHWVINTHLHFDHCGGNTRYDGAQERPAFPKATYFVQRGEMEAARFPNERNRASYLSRNWACIGSRFELLDGECELMPGISVFPSPGHTAHHQSVRVEREGRVVVFLGDVMPTVNHIALPWIMSYDLYPVTTLETKKRLLSQMVDEEWLSIFEHEAFRPLGRVCREEDKFLFEEAQDLATKRWCG
ncbi:MAG: MBL fold metallo-hydrolase [Acidobacteria bacterium]|nr:MBL fold metallo-hydrolase [Acidobacteriota bacterium]